MGAVRGQGLHYPAGRSYQLQPGAKWLSTGLIAVSPLGKPIGSTLPAYLFLGESLGAARLGGGVLILAAIYIAAVNEKNEGA